MAIRILLEDMSARREDDPSIWTGMINLSHIDVLRDRLASLSVTLPALRKSTYFADFPEQCMMFGVTNFSFCKGALLASIDAQLAS